MVIWSNTTGKFHASFLCCYHMESETNLPWFASFSFGLLGALLGGAVGYPDNFAVDLLKVPKVSFTYIFYLLPLTTRKGLTLSPPSLQQPHLRRTTSTSCVFGLLAKCRKVNCPVGSRSSSLTLLLTVKSPATFKKPYHRGARHALETIGWLRRRREVNSFRGICCHYPQNFNDSFARYDPSYELRDRLLWAGWNSNLGSFTFAYMVLPPSSSHFIDKF